MAQGTCSVDGCEEQRLAKGLCRRHYNQLRRDTYPRTQPPLPPRPLGPLTAERLREVLDYDQSTGIFRRKIAIPGTRIGDIPGGKTVHGYWRICVDCTTYRAHRLAWFWTFGVWPDGELDHRNEDKSDNRIANLREAHGRNMQNLSKPQRRNPSGYIGVTRSNKNRWRAAIRVNGEYHHIGCFATPEEASAAYLAAKAELHELWASR